MIIAPVKNRSVDERDAEIDLKAKDHREGDSLIFFYA